MSDSKNIFPKISGLYSQLKFVFHQPPSEAQLCPLTHTVPFWSVIYRKCTGKFQPFSFRQSCIISQDCVLGPWQGLTTINQTCVSRNNVVKSGYLYQKRDVIQIPLGDGKPCGPLEEYIPIKSSQKINCPRWWSQILWNEEGLVFLWQFLDSINLLWLKSSV